MSASHDRGTPHFIRERLTSILLIPLTVWFIATMVAYAGAEHAAVLALLSDPLNAVLMASFVGIGLYHSALGVQVVVEDYLHGGQKRGALTASWLAHLVVAGVCFYAIAKIAF